MTHESNQQEGQPQQPRLTPGISINAFIKEAEELQQAHRQKMQQQPADTGMLTMKTANQWIDEAKTRPIPQMLFSEYWYEGELCILFADTNTGKSILAVQVADSISRGAAIQGFKLQAQAQPVLYLDFELYDKQFEARYSINYTQHYSFSDRLQRIEIDADRDIPDEFYSVEDYLVWSLERAIQQSGARVVIVDNITYLRNETERAKDALPLMKHLKGLKKKYNLSILALAHTPKRDMSKPLTRNDLQGSKMLINFCDSSFCIGESVNDKSIRYLKQIKARNTEVIYDTTNVSLCRIEKPRNFLQFTHVGYAVEKEHLAEVNDEHKKGLILQAKELKSEGKTLDEIAVILNVSRSTAGNYVNAA